MCDIGGFRRGAVPVARATYLFFSLVFDVGVKLPLGHAPSPSFHSGPIG
jgi:hypothetical protein